MRRVPAAVGPDIAAATTLVLLYLGCIAGYLLYFALLGPSYQQWKLAASAVFPLGFIPLAVLCRAALALWPGGWAGRGLVVAGITAVALNLAAARPQFNRYGPIMARFAPLRVLTELETAPDIATIGVFIERDLAGSKITGQFVNRKPLLALRSPEIPEAAGGGMLVVTNICPLLDQPPLAQLGLFCATTSLALRDAYSISFAAGPAGMLDTTGLAAAGPEGAWSVARRVSMILPVNPQWESAIVRVDGEPLLAPCAASQRLLISANGEASAETALSAPAPVEFTMRREVLAGKHLVALSIELPDAVPPKVCGTGDDWSPRGFRFRSITVTGQRSPL